MADVIEIIPGDECYMIVNADPSIREELSEYFTFKVPGYQFMPAFKRGTWDGHLRLYNRYTKTLYKGLHEYVRKFCRDRGYNFVTPFDDEKEHITEEEIVDFSKEIGFPFDLYWYQKKYIKECIENNRALALSPTSSGKSAMIYMLHRHYDRLGERMLLIVPTVGLVAQMAGDFSDYGYDRSKIHTISSGKEKDSDCPVVISTWQSIYKMPPEWFQKFGVVVVDEAHLAAAKSITGIMIDKMPNCKYRFGFTGTIDEESKTAKLTLEGLFGPVKKIITTKEMIEGGHAATTKVKGIVLDHTAEVKKKFKENIKKIKEANKEAKTSASANAYKMETEFLMGLNSRNKFIRNLAWNLDGNVLIMVTRVEHGRTLKEMLEKEGKKVHFIYGGVGGEERDALRKLIENDEEKNHIIIGSYGVFSTGVSIKRLDYLIFAMGMKSIIKTLQSIGRLLRKGNGSDDTVVFDIGDKLVEGKQENFSLAHFLRRCEYYQKEKFKLSIKKVKL